MLIMNWEYQKVDGTVAKDTIPEQSIRLRIFAHSDSPSDQQVKREVRDVVVDHMQNWTRQLEKTNDIHKARTVIRSHLDDIKQLVKKQLVHRQLAHSVVVELGQVSFPTKLYGGKVYPAGNYEAVKIKLGEGKGQNWWCVLFPPLCFIDASTGDAVPKNDPSLKATTQSVLDEQRSTVEVRFFLWDVAVSAMGWIHRFFH